MSRKKHGYKTRYFYGASYHKQQVESLCSHSKSDFRRIFLAAKGYVNMLSKRTY